MSDNKPDRVWLLHGLGDDGGDVWSDDPHPGEGDPPASTPYLRSTPDRRSAEGMAATLEQIEAEAERMANAGPITRTATLIWIAKKAGETLAAARRERESGCE